MPHYFIQEQFHINLYCDNVHTFENFPIPKLILGHKSQTCPTSASCNSFTFQSTSVSQNSSTFHISFTIYYKFPLIIVMSLLYHKESLKLTTKSKSSKKNLKFLSRLMIYFQVVMQIRTESINSIATCYFFSLFSRFLLYELVTPQFS